MTTTSGDIAFFGLDFEYQQNLFERASLRLSLEGNARVGTDNQSLLASGLSSSYGMELEAKFRILRYSQMVLTAHAVLTDKSLYGLDPLGFAQGIAEDGFDDNDKLVVEGDLNRLVSGRAPPGRPKPGSASRDTFRRARRSIRLLERQRNRLRGGLTVKWTSSRWLVPDRRRGGYDSTRSRRPTTTSSKVCTRSRLRRFIRGATISRSVSSSRSHRSSRRIDRQIWLDHFSLNSRYYF